MALTHTRHAQFPMLRMSGRPVAVAQPVSSNENITSGRIQGLRPSNGEAVLPLITLHGMGTSRDPGPHACRLWGDEAAIGALTFDK